MGDGSHAPHLRLGARGEKLAARHLRTLGYRVLGRNVRTRGGEADLVMLDPDGRSIVLVEVKSRVGGSVDPQLAIGRNKQARLLRTLVALRAKHRWRDRPGRIDVVTVWWREASGAPEVRHYVNAVSASGR